MSVSISKEQSAIISDLFETMKETSVSPSYSGLAKQWLETCGCFTGFVDGKWMQTASSKEGITNIEIMKGLSISIQLASYDELATVVENSREGFKIWKQYNSAAKSKELYKISELIQQQSKLINAVDNLTKYGRMREKYNVKYLIDSFAYYASLVGDEESSEDWKPTGVVCLICVEDTLVPSLWAVSAILASGNAVVCLVDCRQNLTAFLLAELCNSSGLPPGIFNVISCDISSLPNLPDVDKIILSSPIQLTFLSGAKNTPCEIIPYQWPCVIIYDSADLDAAISNILDTMHIFDVKEPWPICKIYLQESIQKKFIRLLTLKLCGTLGDHTDCRPPFYLMGSEVTVEQTQSLLTEYCGNDSTKEIFTVGKCSISEGENQCIPSAIMNFSSNLDQDQTIRRGPGVYIEQFRTVKESIAMFNLNKKNCNVSLWSEEVHLSLEVANKLKSRSVWINCQNIYTPSVTNGSLYLSGNSNIGGKEGVFSYLCLNKSENDSKNDDSNGIQSYGSKPPNSSNIPLKDKTQKVNKLFIGGSYVNSSADTFQQAFDAKNKPYSYVASASKSDIDKAVSSASSAQPKWESILKIKRAVVLRKAVEILNKKKDEFVSELHTVTGKAKELCSKEVEKAISVLLYWENHIAHFGGQIVETQFSGKVLQEYHPLGVIGIQCPDNEPLLSFVFLITPAIVYGNAVVAISSEKYPTCALKMCEVFQASGLPAGVLNVVSSSRSYLTRHLSSHLNIDAIWFTEDGADFIYDSYHTIQPKKILDCKNMTNSLDKTKATKLLFESTYSKAIFIPTGTGFT